MRRWRSAMLARYLFPIDRYGWLATIMRGNMP
jgi:hypothetical protein